MGAGDDESSEQARRTERKAPETNCQVRRLREKIVRLEKMMSQQEKYKLAKDSEVIIESERGTSHVDSISESVGKEEALHKQTAREMGYFEDDIMQQIADLEENVLTENITSKKLSLLELYRNLQILEENTKCLDEESGHWPEVFQNKAGLTCREYHLRSGHIPYKKEKKELMRCPICLINHKRTPFQMPRCNEYEHNGGTVRSKLNVSPEKLVPLAKTMCSCHNISSSSDDSEESMYNYLHVPEDQLNENSRCDEKDVDGESESSSEDRTMCSEMSKCTCYCNKNESHGESSEADSDREEMRCEKLPIKETKKERFRGGLDVITPRTTVMKYDKNLKEKVHQSASNALVDKFKVYKVEELREGLERLKIRNRNLREFLDSLQNPMNLTGKPSEANTICTQVSSCYTFDVARQTRSGLLTVVEVLKGRCRSKDAVIVALADELKTGSSKKINVQDNQSGKIVTQDKSLVWNGLVDEKDNSRKFTKKDSAIGFIVFLMILISHVKRSEMVSYLGAAKKILTESPFKLVLFINETENLSVDLISTYYEDFTNSFRNFIKHSVDRWTNIMAQCSHYLDSYYLNFQQHLDVANDFLTTNQLCLLFTLSAIFVGISLMNFRKLWVKSVELLDSENDDKFYISFKSAVIKFTKFVRVLGLKVLSARIFWVILGFYSHVLWNLMQPDFDRLVDSFKVNYYINAENSLLRNFNESEIASDSRLFDRFDYSWLVSILCNKLQSFVEFTRYILKNI